MAPPLKRPKIIINERITHLSVISIVVLDETGIIVSTNMLSVFLMDIYTVPIKREVFGKNVNSF